MLTIREILTLPALAKAEVVAGHDGLDNQIRWAHIVDIPDTHYISGRTKVLLLTAGFGMRDDQVRQETLVKNLIQQGYTALIFSTGYYFDTTPQVIRKSADEAAFPVLEVPPEVMFIEITEAIFEQIINRQYGLLRQANEIHEQLTNMVLQGGDLHMLAQTLASFIKRSITIENTASRMLAYAQYGPIDEARHRSVSQGHTTPEVVQRLYNQGIYEKLLKEMAPVRLPPMPDLGMMERIVAPIIVDREIHGYIWIIAGDRALTDLDELAIRHGATVAALIIFKEQAVREVEGALRGDFFEQLIKGAKASAVLGEQARQLGYRLKQSHQLLLIHPMSLNDGSNRPFANVVDNWLRSQGHRALIVWRDDNLVIVFESRRASEGKKLAESMLSALNHPTRQLLIGVGRVFGTPKEEPFGVQRSYEEAREAVEVGIAFDYQEGIVTFEELGLLHWLYHLTPEHQNQNAYLGHIRTLVEYDKSHKTELIKTLETYLDHGGSLVETAQALYIHRNTLLHRINRIEDLCKLEIRNPLQRLNLHAAVKSFHLHKERHPTYSDTNRM